MVFAAAAVLAAAMAHTMGAAAYSNDRMAAGAGKIAAFGGAGKVEPDPVDDGSIIIECVMLGARATFAASGSRTLAAMRLVSVPRHPLGPAKCWSQEHKGVS
jgi:hypothetical protein